MRTAAMILPRAGALLEQEAAGSGSQALQEVLVGVHRGQQNDPGRRREAEHLPGHLHAVHVLHMDVGDEDVDLMGLHKSQDGAR